MGAGRHLRTPPLYLNSLYYFLPFLTAAGFLYEVSMVVPREANIDLAESANGPSGFSCRYFWNASEVPATGVTLPSVLTVALERR